MTPRLATLLRLCDVLRVQPNDLLLASPTAALRSDGMSPELRQLAAVLDGADAIVVKRVTEVARWLRTTGTRRSRTIKKSSKRTPRKSRRRS